MDMLVTKVALEDTRRVWQPLAQEAQVLARVDKQDSQDSPFGLHRLLQGHPDIWFSPRRIAGS